MMSDVDQLLKQYIEAHRAGEPDPTPFLDQAGDQRDRLVAMIDFYLEHAPARDWDSDAYRASELPNLVDGISRSVQGAGGLWPAQLPQLRHRARVKRADLVGELAARLGAESKRNKVADYYHAMEQGLLPVNGVSDTVLTALGKIVGESTEALRSAGQAIAPGPGPFNGPAFARTGRAPADADQEQAPAAAPPLPEQEWDEVDRLFRGG